MGTDAKLMLDMMRQQLNWIEREMAILRGKLHQPLPSDKQPSFEALRGIWVNIDFTEEDFQASRLEIPENL